MWPLQNASKVKVLFWFFRVHIIADDTQSFSFPPKRTRACALHTCAEHAQHFNSLWRVGNKKLSLTIYKNLYFKWKNDFNLSWIRRQRKLRMAAFMDTEGSVVKEMNIQRRSINGSQVSAILAVSYDLFWSFKHSVIHFHSSRHWASSVSKAFLPFAKYRSIKFNHDFRCC